MAINRLGNHTGKKKHTTLKSRLTDFYLNPFKFVGYRNNCFFSHTNPFIVNVIRNSADGHISSLGHLWLPSFERAQWRLQLFGSITLNIFMIQTLCTVMQLFKGSYFSVDAASRHFWPNSAIANGTTLVFMSCVSPASR